MKKYKFRVKRLLAGLILINLIVTLFSCTRTETGPSYKTAVLTVDNMSAEEIWLKYDKGGETGTVKVIIKRNDNKILGFTLTGQDTVICDDSLTPNTNYTYQSYILSEYLPKNAPKPVTAKTLDTTSHDFTWQAYTFGVAGTSELKDVAINNENDIWAVGDVYLKDSTGKLDDYRYNAFHWNGSYWENKRIVNYTEPGSSCADFYTVFILPDGGKIFSSGIPYLQENNYWKSYPLWDMGVLLNTHGGIIKIWGTSINDLYFVGPWGSIVYLNAVRWQRIDLKDKYDFADIWGITNPLNNTSEAYCAGSDWGDASNYNPVFRKAVFLRISNGTKTDTISWNGQPLYTLWTHDGKRFYAGGGELYFNKKARWEKVPLEGITSVSRVRGNGLNDIFAVGNFGVVCHFNGKTWKSYKQFGGMHFSSVAVKGNLVVAAGSTVTSQGVVLIGRRN